MKMPTERSAFLAARKTGIGGSDSAAILGLSKHKTALDVWLDKTGQSDEDSDNEAMYWGRALEEPILKRYSEDTGRSIAKKAMVRDAIQLFVVANLDGVSYESKDGIPCNPRVVEAKTASNRDEWGEEGTDQIPIPYLLQVQHYMMVTGLPLADIPVLFNRSKFAIFTVRADQDLHDMMRERYAKFWDCVLTQTPPELSGHSDIVKLYGRSSCSESVEATEEVAEALSKLRDRRLELRSCEEEIERLQGIVMQHMGNADTLTVGGSVVVTWKSTKPRVTLDSKALKEKYPTIYAELSKEGNPSRRFLIKGE